MKNTFVIIVDEAAADWLDAKEHQGAGDPNEVITGLLRAEKERQSHGERSNEGVYPQDLCDLTNSTPDAGT